MPVLHHGPIFLIVIPYQLQAVAEGLTSCEILFKSRETAVHRVSSRIDKNCIWHNVRYEPDVRKIIWHFVDEIRFTRTESLSLL